MPIGIDDLVDLSKGIDNYDELNDALNDFLEKVFPIASVQSFLHLNPFDSMKFGSKKFSRTRIKNYTHKTKNKSIIT